MPYTIRIRFSGLCAFVPNSVSANGVESMDVLLVNSGNKNAAGLAKKDPHTPVMKFDLKNLTGSNGDVGGASGWWKLNQSGTATDPPISEDLEFRAVPRTGGAPQAFSGGFRVSLYPKALTVEQPTEDTTLGNPASLVDLARQFASFSWVPSIEGALPGAGYIDPNWIGDSLASARLRLDAGVLQTELLGKYGDEMVLTQFLPATTKSPNRKALAHWVVLEIPNVPDDLDLLVSSKRLSDGQPRRSITLRPYSGDATPIVQLEVTNLCCGYYISGNQQASVVPSADDDFELFYTLSKNFVGLKAQAARFPVPTPVSFPVVAPGKEVGQEGGADPVRCTMCQFNGYGQ